MDKLFEESHPTYPWRRAPGGDHGKFQSMSGIESGSSFHASSPSSQTGAGNSQATTHIPTLEQSQQHSPVQSHGPGPASSFDHMLSVAGHNVADHGHIAAYQFNRGKAPPYTQQIHQLTSGTRASKLSTVSRGVDAPNAVKSLDHGLSQNSAPGHGQTRQNPALLEQHSAVSPLPLDFHSSEASNANPQTTHGDSQPNGPAINFKGNAAKCNDMQKKYASKLFMTFCENVQAHTHILPIGQLDGESTLTVESLFII